MSIKRTISDTDFLYQPHTFKKFKHHQQERDDHIDEKETKDPEQQDDQDEEKEPDWSGYAQQLYQQGVVVIPLPDTIPFPTLKHLKETIYSFKEVKPILESTNQDEKEPHRPVLSYFGAMSCPSSFHNTMVRDLRSALHPLAKKLLQHHPDAMTSSTPYRFHQLFDRLSWRLKDKMPGTKESAHRDQSPHKKPGDHIFGGWINLDDSPFAYPQRFTCIPGTHNDQDADCKTGFAKLDPKTIDESRFQTILIPPRSWIIFSQNIIHQVNPKKPLLDSFRLYTGFRLTQHKSPLQSDLLEVMKNQAVPQLPSGQSPVMIESLHWCKYMRVVEWSTRVFRSEVLRSYIPKKTRGDSSAPTTSEQLFVVETRMKSLADYGFSLYPSYSPNETALYFPQPLF